jgi:HEAT repeat protein
MVPELLTKIQTRHPDFIEDSRFQCIYLNDVRWTEPIAIILAELDDRDCVIRIVRLALEVDLFLGARLAGAVKQEFQSQTVAMVSALSVPQWLRVELLGRTRSTIALPSLLDALNDGDANIRSLAASALGASGDRAAIPALMNALGDTHCVHDYSGGGNASFYDVRPVVAKALERFDPDAVIPYLVSELTSPTIDTQWQFETPFLAEMQWQAIELLGRLATEATIPILINALEHENFGVRSKAAEILGTKGAEAAIPALIETLKDRDANVRYTAIIALGNLNAKSAIPNLIDVLTDEGSNVRKKAAQILDEFRTDLAIPAFIKALTDNDYEVQHIAAQALVNLDNAIAVPALLDAIKHQDRGVRGNAASALGNTRNPAAIPALIAALADEEPFVVYNAVEWGLKKTDLDERAIAEVVNGLTTENYLMRRGAAYAVGMLGVTAAIPTLIGLLDDPNANVRSSAAKALGLLGADLAITELIALLRDRDDKVKLSAIYALGILRAEVAIPQLILTLKERNLREIAVSALEEIGSELAIPALLDFLPDEHFDRNVSSAIEKLASPASIPSFIRGLQHHNQEVRQYSALMLGSLGNHEAIPALFKALADENKYVRVMAARSLGALSVTDEAISTLIELLKDPDYRIREKVIEALGSIDSPTVTPILIDCLKDLDGNVRASAVKALEPLASAETIPTLSKVLMDDDSWYVQMMAVKVLVKIGTDEAITMIVNSLKNKASDVILESTRAIAKAENKSFVHSLIFILDYDNYEIRNLVGTTIRESANERMISALNGVLLNGNYSKQTIDIITQIQTMFGFYNYDKFCLSE